MSPVDPIVEALRQARIEKGWSQRRLALVAGLAAGHWPHIERGNYGMTISTARKVADALGFDLVLKERG